MQSVGCCCWLFLVPRVTSREYTKRAQGNEAVTEATVFLHLAPLFVITGHTPPSLRHPQK